MNGGEGRIADLGQVQVVKAHDGHVPGHRFSRLAQALDDPGPQDVRRREDSGDAAVFLADSLCGGQAVVEADSPGMHQVFIQGQTCCLQGVLVAQKALLHDPVFLHIAGDKGNPAMPLGQQIGGGHPAPLPVVNADGVEGLVLHVGVHQHHGDGQLVQFVQAAGGVGAHDDDAVHPPVPGDADIALPHAGPRQQQVVAAFPGVVFQAGQQGAVEGVVKHELPPRLCLGNHNTDQIGAPAGEAAGVEVGDIVQFCSGIPHPLRGLPADGLSGDFVENIAYRGGGHPGFPGYVLDADPAHACLPVYLTVSVTPFYTRKYSLSIRSPDLFSRERILLTNMQGAWRFSCRNRARLLAGAWRGLPSG